MEIKIEDARSEHVEGIQEVFYRTWLSTYPNEEFRITVSDIEDRFKDRNSPERLERRREDIVHLGESRKFLVALDGGRVVGVARALRGETENRLSAIYVLPEYQGRGIGTRLWSAIREVFDPSKDILVGVATYNQHAIDFYTKLGFEDSGERYTDERYRMKSGSLLPQMDMVLRAKAS